MYRNIFVLVLVACVLGALSACGGGATADAAKQSLAIVNNDMTQILADARALLIELSQIQEVRGVDPGACEKVMRTRYNNNPEFTAFGMAIPDGTLVCLSQMQTSPANIADRAYFQRAFQSKNFSVGDYQIGKATNKPSVGLGYPLLDSAGNVFGVVLAPIDLDWLNRRLANLKLPNGAQALIVDSQGTVLATTTDPQTWTGKSIAGSALGKAMLAQKQGAGEFAGADNVTRVYAFASPTGSNNNWVVAVGLAK